MVEVSELDANSARAHNYHGRRQVLEDNGFAAADDLVAIDGQGRNGAGAGAGGENNVFGVKSGSLRGNGHRSPSGQPALTGDVVYLIFAKQVGHAPDVTVDNLPAAVHGYGVIGAEIVEAQAELFGAVKVGDDLSVLEEGLAGDAAPVEADASQGLPLDDGGLES